MSCRLENVIFYLIGPCQDSQTFHIWNVRVLNPLLGYIKIFKLGISGQRRDRSKARANPKLFRGFLKKTGNFCDTSSDNKIWGAKRSVLSVVHCTITLDLVFWDASITKRDLRCLQAGLSSASLVWFVVDNCPDSFFFTTSKSYQYFLIYITHLPIL